MKGNLAKKAKTGPPDEEQGSAMDEAGGMEEAIKAAVNAAVAAAEKKKDLEREEAVKDASSESIRALLEFEESSDITFACRGLRNSHTSTKHARANISHGCKFELCAVKPPFLVDAALKRGSKLMIDVANAKLSDEKEMVFSNEADTGVYSISGVCDALTIVNAKLAEIPGNKVSLCACREWMLPIKRGNPNRADCAIVVDATSGAPVCIIEDKQPSKKLADAETVAGQLRDYLVAMYAFGHPNPFAVLTSIDTSWVVWCPDIGNSAAIAQEENRFDRVDSILEPLPGKPVDTTPAPQKTFKPDTVRNITDHRTRSGSSTPKPRFEPSTAARRLSYSKPYSLHQLVPLLCNVIMCGLENFSQNNRPLLSLSAKQYDDKTESRRVLKFCASKTGTFQGTLEGRVRGIAPTHTYLQTFKDFYILDFIASGSTSKVFQAVSLDGHLCVIKVYVKRFDGKELLKADTFNKNAMKSVRTEVSRYHLIYPELKDHVWCQKLNGYQCVIMPYFLPIKEDERESTLKEIQKVLTKNFKPNGFQFADSDQRWRHIGTYNDKFYLFDLADLEPAKGAFVKAHVAALASRFERPLA